ncbi:PREDICTED: regulator of microtubule dynamics protein 1-like [Dufourea novaeangliae]|uniref:Regulator of microtubule dynamics protein 1 n=1 Tax=Dufourea novaeangliae TaxID=178035 RepID=A0A154PJ20_DUFNO|nr:PREDICTED: regulator of microtubule dynamics protein 1-like [Dufourea novaeangliae]KZC11200.1 Regulator of microtubule dynamics protein 1 [Dufourea novaeangliae]
MGVWGLSKKKGEGDGLTAKEVLIAKADALFDQGNYKEIYNLLSNYRDSGDVEILWRLSRALYKMAKIATDVEGKKMIYEAYDLLNIALKIKEDHWAVHKWMSIILDSRCSYEGMKVRLRELYNIKNHMLRAIELNPRDTTTMYMLGTWCYQISDLTWYQRKIAAIIFETPPISSFEEALQYFLRAEEVEPNFYSHNLLMLGKSYLKLNQKDEALKYLKMAVEYPAKNDDDHTAKQEAQKLLKDI